MFFSVKDYLSRTKGSTSIDAAMRADLTKLEQSLLDTQEVLETRGKVTYFMNLKHFFVLHEKQD